MPEENINPLRDSEEIIQRARLAAIVESSEDAIISKDLDGVITSWNKGAEKVFGYTAEETIGKPVTILIPPHRLDEEPMIIDRIRRGEPTEHYETVRRRKDGTQINISLTVSPIRDETGKVIGASKIARDITEKVLTEEILRENQMMLALAMQSSRMGAWERDIATEIVIWSEELEEIFGLEKGAFDQTLEAFDNLVYEEDRAHVRSTVENAVKENREYTMEFRFYHADGSVRWMEGRGQAVYSAKGEPVRLYGIGIDITERKRAEDVMRQSAKQLALITDTIPVFLAQCDSQRRYKFVNKANAERFGLKPEDFIGKTVAEILGEGAYNAIRSYIDIVLTGKPVEFEAEIPYDGIGAHFMSCSYVPEFDANGQVVGWVGAIADITEHKLTQEKLIAIERRAVEDYQALLSRMVPLAQTLGTTRSLLTIYRRVTDFIRASMPCTAFFISFYDPAKSLRTAAYAWGVDGEVDISALPPMKLTEDGGPNSQAIFQKKSVIVNHYWDFMKKRPHIVLQEDGNDPNSAIVVPMKVSNRILGTFEVQTYEDNAFTEEHIIAVEMVANLAAVAIENMRLLDVEATARLHAETANRAKDEFLSVVSHELRTPLNAMLGWTRMLQLGELDETQTAQAIETIERNARLQNNLIEDLLDVSRIISGKLRIEREEVDIVSIVQTCVDTAKPSAQEKSVSLIFESDLSAQKLNGDSTRLQQIVNNLLNNAVKFTPAEGSISVILKQRGNKTLITVADSGIGIAPAFLPMIFERFKQADGTTKRSHSGLGLGLTIVRHLTELHGGTVEVFSPGEGFGATFTIELPAASERVLFADTPAPTRNDFKLKGAKILLVDDDCEGIQPLQLLLETQEADVSCAESAKEALEKLGEERFDILVSDIGMPEMDGFELISEVQKLTNKQNYRLPAIALTAYASSEDRERALSAGFHTHLAKPIDFDQFLLTVDNLLARNERLKIN